MAAVLATVSKPAVPGAMPRPPVRFDIRSRSLPALTEIRRRAVVPAAGCQRRNEDASAGRSKNASRAEAVNATPSSAFQFDQGACFPVPTWDHAGHGAQRREPRAAPRAWRAPDLPRARIAAALRRSAPNGRARRTMPRPVRDEAAAPGSAHIERPWPDRSRRPRGECARWSSRACDRRRWCGGGCRWSADARRSARLL